MHHIAWLMIEDHLFSPKCDVKSKCSIHAIKERTPVGTFHKKIYRHYNVDSFALDLSVLTVVTITHALPAAK
jgi:hypothetical protein